MQCGTMSVKNLVRHLRVNGKTDHTLEVKSLSLGKIIGKPVRVMLFSKNAHTIWDRHMLKGALKPGNLPPRPRF